jgi:hypothetical protein
MTNGVQSIQTQMPFTAPVLSEDASGEEIMSKYILPILVTTVTSHFLLKTVDNIFFEQEKGDRDRMFKDISHLIETSELPRESDMITAMTKSRDKISESDKKDSYDDLDELISKSIKSMEEAARAMSVANTKTKCKVCKETLSTLSKEISKGKEKIQENTHYIITAAKKADAMQRLKKQGRLPLDSKWDELSEDQRELVRRNVR